MSEQTKPMMRVAILAAKLWHAEDSARRSRYAYYLRVIAFEENCGGASPVDSNNAELALFAAAQYQAYLSAQKKLGITRRRLELACQQAEVSYADILASLARQWGGT